MFIFRATLLRPMLVSALVGLLIVTTAFWVRQLVWNQTMRNTADAHLDSLARDGSLITTRLRARVNDLSMMKNILEDVSSLSPNGGSVSPAFRLAAKELAISRGIYDQIYLLDPAGREVYRLHCNITPEGTLPTVDEPPPQQLPVESEQFSYQEAMAAPNNAAIFSAHFPATQSGIENSRQPSLRISGKVDNPDGSLRTILVLDYDGDQLLRLLKRQKDREFLVTSEGEWLIRPSTPNNSKAISSDSPPSWLSETDPETRNEMAKASSGWFFKNNKLVCFQKIDPFAEPLDFPLLRMSTVGDEHLRWIFFTETSSAELWANLWTIQWAVFGGTLLALTLLVPAAWVGTSALQNLAKVRYELAQLVQTSPQGIIAFEAVRDATNRIIDLRIVTANNACGAQIGVDPKKMVGKLFRETPPFHHDPHLFDRYCEVIETGQSQALEYHYELGNLDRWLNIKAAKLNDGVVLNVSDVTKRKQMEDDLRESEQLLQMAERISQIGAWSVTFPDRKMNWSRELYKIHEVPANYQPSLEGSFAYYVPEYRGLFRSAFEKCSRDGTPYDLNLEIITAKGRRIWIRNIFGAEFREGKLRRVFGTFQNITEIKRAFAHEQELARQARAAERAKSEFLAVMSHEIRTPMNGILGFAEQLALKPLAPEDKDYVQTIQQCSQSLLRILNDILDYSRIEAGRMEIEEAVFSPVELLEGTRTLLDSLRRDAEVKLKTEVEEGLPRYVLGDSGRVRQILVNLAGNSLKFTKHGTVTLNLRRADEPAPPGYHLLEFSVLDTGIGISSEKLKEIFEPFSQADSSISRRYGGTGLGLTISRRLAKLMGGELTVNSIPGEGSVFTMTLQFRDAGKRIDLLETGPQELFDETFAQRFPLKLLVAEDDPINIKLINLMLKKLGYQIVLAKDGPGTVVLFSKEKPNCILMDLHMPGLSGLEATAKIRELEKKEGGFQSVFIAALTADVLPEERERCLSEGMNAYLTKPIKRESLISVLKEASLRTNRSRPEKS